MAFVQPLFSPAQFAYADDWSINFGRHGAARLLTPIISEVSPEFASAHTHKNSIEIIVLRYFT